LIQKTEANPNGFPIEVIDQWRAAVLADRNQFMTEFRIPFYGFNRPGAKVSQGLLDSFLLQTMLTSLAATHDCIKAFAQTDFTEDLKKFDVPTLIMHGDDDQVVPIAISALVSSKLVKGATLKVYPGLPHGMCSTHKDLINADLLEFISKEQSSAQSA
jgi:non-heme chloroperoxidase